ncbi:MAG TPA: hypothetical protein VFR64_18055 [Methylomirabilota bacterium]|nr:hypothetical protein [Methylomirabilota bacterium]
MNTSVLSSGGRGDTLDPASERSKSPTAQADLKAKSRIIALLLLLTCAATASGDAGDRHWPPFLAPASMFSEDIVATVERLWSAPTLTRTVQGDPAHVPFELYLALVDEPAVMAAAARHLGLARYEVEAIDDGWYRATDNDGARGVWRILARGPTRRIVLSRGEHSGRLLGHIGGSALTILELEPLGDGVQPRLTAHVHIDNRVAAAVARVLIAVFGHLADDKLAEGFRVTAGVAAWAAAQPEAFCAWLAEAPIPQARRARLLDVVSTSTPNGCGLANASLTPPRRSAGPATRPPSTREAGAVSPGSWR